MKYVPFWKRHRMPLAAARDRLLKAGGYSRQFPIRARRRFPNDNDAIRDTVRYNLQKRYSMIEFKYTGDALWERIERAVEIIKERLRRVSAALNAAAIPYAVIGGNAVQHWVAQVDESVVRNTRDVDIILNRADLPRAIEALAQVGFTTPAMNNWTLDLLATPRNQPKQRTTTFI